MFHIAHNTYKEIIRNRLLYLIFFFAFIFIIFSLVLGTLTIGESEKIIVDFGIAMIEIFGIITVLFIGSQLLFKEIEGKTIFLIFSKPIPRSHFIIGKFLGFAAVITVMYLLQYTIYILMLLLQDIRIYDVLFFALVFTFLKLLILLALVFLLSSFMHPIGCIIVSILIYILSHSLGVIMFVFADMGGVLMYLPYVLQIIFPPLEMINIKDIIGSGLEISGWYYLSYGIYACIYIVLTLYITVTIFTRKNFENL